MKKLFLLAASAVVSFGASAQYAQSMSVIGGGARQAVLPAVPNNVPVHGKSTGPNDRWYNHSEVIAALTGNMAYVYQPIWQDSTVLQNFTSGLGTINFSSMGQVIDPIHYKVWDDTVLFSSNDMDILVSDAYQVDSIQFTGALRRGSMNRPTTIVDTFILSVAPTAYNYYWIGCSDTDQIEAHYGVPCSAPPNPADTMLRCFTIVPANIDSVNRSQLASAGTQWKVPITDAMRFDTANVQLYTFALPAPLNIPAGSGVAVTVTFKSGDTWTPNVDTFSEYHNFMGISGSGLGTTSWMPYYYYSDNDRDASQLMFSWLPSRYYPSILIESWNGADFRQEFHDIGAHVTCPGCNTIGQNLSVEALNGAVSDVTAYPNPAIDEVNIIFSLTTATNATVSITNAIGQVISSQKVKNVAANVPTTATFSTSNLSTGIYFYTVEANGQRTTDRFVVAH